MIPRYASLWTSPVCFTGELEKDANSGVGYALRYGSCFEGKTGPRERLGPEEDLAPVSKALYAALRRSWSLVKETGVDQVMLSYRKTQQNTARTTRKACIRRAFCGRYYHELSTASGPLPTADPSTDRLSTTLLSGYLRVFLSDNCTRGRCGRYFVGFASCPALPSAEGAPDNHICYFGYK